MGSRESILAKLKANKPELIELPKIDVSVFAEDLELIKEFTKKVEIVGGNVVEATSNSDVIVQIQKMFPGTKVNFSHLEGTASFNSINLESLKDPHKLDDLDILVLESKLAVAENGAVWITDQELPVRVLPFITKHLVFVISKKDIVPYMHDAYGRISDFGFGVFISGPSKTADIEQSLVIGAQGALSLTVFLK